MTFMFETKRHYSQSSMCNRLRCETHVKQIICCCAWNRIQTMHFHNIVIFGRSASQLVPLPLPPFDSAGLIWLRQRRTSQQQQTSASAAGCISLLYLWISIRTFTFDSGEPWPFVKLKSVAKNTAFLIKYSRYYFIEDFFLNNTLKINRAYNLIIESTT